ncbi:MAG: RHS repeat-associated core domain-containing protein [Chloroflexi bacterium]|nr:RHS repeat-associated core domain-containing protein [Chloroflexota bacterium]
MALTDGSGSVIATYKYDVFGAVRSSSGSGSTEYRFTGQQEDATLAYYYLRARYYDPAIGRFISKDPFPGFVTNPQSQNPYTYVGNDPTNVTDPSGEFAPIVAGLVWLAANTDIVIILAGGISLWA